ncbi:hypothetical protein M231_06338 [Tremella mesenterica]|uniref:Brl1/Brr6 domain-containing protein n=1 Tax=Tremella mesenterica TaxID=5217 RepID=A0A4Q1BC14_TREME|nr:hypothetical protein M231_06338 [Tremella mesenterica]
MRFDQRTPFIYETIRVLSPGTSTPKKFSYDPSIFQPSASAFGDGLSSQNELEDVEMTNEDSPARPYSLSDRDTSGEAPGPEGSDASRHEEKIEKLQRKDRPIATGAVTRVRKKREKEWKEKSEHHHTYHLAPQPVRHSEIPYILLGYLQFFVNASVVVFCLYLAVLFVRTVQRDVKDKMREYSVEVLQEISECTNLYLTNRCDPSTRVPAMDGPCRAWEICMNRDPTILGRTNVIAETFAGVINSFVDAISWKTMAFTLVTLAFFLGISNSALMNLRSRHRESMTHQPGPHSPPFPTFPSHMSHLQHGPLMPEYQQQQLYYSDPQQRGVSNSGMGQLEWNPKPKGIWDRASGMFGKTKME